MRKRVRSACVRAGSVRPARAEPGRTGRPTDLRDPAWAGVEGEGASCDASLFPPRASGLAWARPGPGPARSGGPGQVRADRRNRNWALSASRIRVIGRQAMRRAADSEGWARAGGLDMRSSL
jgi:hypothetical protein